MSVGVVIVTHYGLGDEFLLALEKIVPEAPKFATVSLDPSHAVDALREQILSAIRSADEGEGVLILTDMFGGTPSNLALSFLDEHPIEVVTGINLPMLIKLATLREPKQLGELAVYIKDYGRRNISVASQLLPGAES